MYSLCYASARPHLIAGVIALWESRCRRPENVEWCVVINDNQDFPLPATKSIRYLEDRIEPPHTRIKAYNQAARLSSGNWLVCVADDWVPCDGWDEQLEFGTRGFNHLNLATVLIHDLHKPRLMSLPVMSRGFYHQEGHFLYPEYAAWYADDDMTSVAQLRGKPLGSVFGFIHNHPDYGTREKDAVDLALTDEIKERDRQTFIQRQKDGFPILKP